MTDGFDKLLDIVSKRFLLAYFLPLALFALLNFHIADVVFSEFENPLINEGEGEIAWTVVSNATLFLVILALSYVLSPFNRLFREFIAGQRLKWIWYPLQKFQSRKYQKFSSKIRDHKLKVALYANKEDEWRKLLRTATQAGAKLAAPPGLDKSTLRKLAEKMKPIQNMSYLSWSQPEKKLDLVVELLCGALANVRLKPECMQSSVLSRYLEQIEDALIMTRKRLDREYADLEEDFAFRFDPLTIEPSTIGNLESALSHYAFDRYGMSYEIFWAHLMTLKADDEAFQTQITDTESRIELMANLIALSLVFVLFWPVYFWFLYDGDARWLWAGSTLLLPALGVTVYYLAMLYSTQTLMRLKRSAIDLFRFELIDEYNVSRPKNLLAEKKLWTTIHRHRAFGEANEGAGQVGSIKYRNEDG